jgi:hypothetical protein
MDGRSSAGAKAAGSVRDRKASVFRNGVLFDARDVAMNLRRVRGGSSLVA